MLDVNTHNIAQFAYLAGVSVKTLQRQDLMTIIHCFSSRLYGLRNYRKAIQKALKDGQGTQDPAQSIA
jgi:hypothetical protein